MWLLGSAEPIAIPNAARLLYRLDAHLGFFSRPITTREQVADAYMVLLVIEERAIRQCAKDNHCPSGMKCNRGKCEKACTADDECVGNEICEGVS